jgi:DNA modification methylase
MKIERVPIESVHEDPRNARQHPAKNLEAIRGSLERFEQVEPLVVQASTGRVIGGNGRLQVMRELGWEQVEIVRVEVDDQAATALGLALNRTAEIAEWDDRQLAELLREVGDVAVGVGWDEKELVSFLASVDRKEVVQDEVPEPPKVAVTKPGDVWTLGRHRVVCGDCRDTEAPAIVELVATDPPYGLGGYAGRSGKHEPMEGDETPLSAWISVLPKAQASWIWCDWRSYPGLVAVRGLPDALIVWVKEWPTMGSGYRGRHEFAAFWGDFASTAASNVIENAYRADGIASTWQRTETMSDHPTQKPVECFAVPIRNHTQPGSLVYDPFLGSGTTLIAAEQLDRTCYGIEIEPRYVDVVVERWEQLTGGKAKRIKGRHGEPKPVL